MTASILLLPGLDGTARLFSRFLPHLPAEWLSVPVAYPADRVLDMDGLATVARSRAPATRPFAIVAESFSGPVALRIAASRPANLVALVLVATFVTPPMARVLRLLVPVASDVGARLPVPRRLIRSLMLGPHGPEDLVAEVESAIHSVRSAVLSSRLKMLASIDALSDLRACPVPILYLGATRDRLVPSACVHQITTEPSVTARFLDGPHLLLQTRPEAAAREITAFVGSLAGQT